MIKEEKNCSYIGGEDARPLRNWLDFSSAKYLHYKRFCHINIVAQTYKIINITIIYHLILCTLNSKHFIFIGNIALNIKDGYWLHINCEDNQNKEVDKYHSFCYRTLWFLIIDMIIYLCMILFNFMWYYSPMVIRVERRVCLMHSFPKIQS